MSRVSRTALAHTVAVAAVLGSLACRATHERTPDDTAASGTSASAGAAATASPSAASAEGATAEDLTFTGAVSGRMTTGKKGGVYFCGKLGPRYIADPIEGDVGGTPLDFSITIGSGYEGAGTYQSTKELTPGSTYAAVTVGLAHAGSSTKEWVNGTGANTVTVDADERSGTVNADLRATGGKSGTVHVSGHWRCPPD